MTYTKLIQIIYWSLEPHKKENVPDIDINKLAQDIMKELEREGKFADLREVAAMKNLGKN